MNKNLIHFCASSCCEGIAAETGKIAYDGIKMRDEMQL
jgi:hypothetical protein